MTTKTDADSSRPPLAFLEIDDPFVHADLRSRRFDDFWRELTEKRPKVRALAQTHMRLGDGTSGSKFQKHRLFRVSESIAGGASVQRRSLSRRAAAVRRS